MTIETKYICDKCKKEIPKDGSDSPFWKIKVTAQSSEGSNYAPVYYNADVCRECLHKLGIHTPKAKEGESETPKPTLMEAIQEAIDISVEKAMDGRNI